MSLHLYLRKAFLRRILSTPEGRAHMLNLAIEAEEGDEAGVFDRLQHLAEDEEVRRTVERHQRDEHRHARMFRSCLQRTGVDPGPLPDRLRVIRRIGDKVGGGFAAGQSAEGIQTRRDVMEVYALLLVIEERGVEQFPIIAQELRPFDPQSADIFLAVAKDERRHVGYCQDIGRRYAPDEQTWLEAVRKYRAIEAAAFAEIGLDNIVYTIDRGILELRPLELLVARAVRHMRGGMSSAHLARSW